MAHPHAGTQNALAGLNCLRLSFFCPCMAHPHAVCVLYTIVHFGEGAYERLSCHWRMPWRRLQSMNRNEVNSCQHHINITCRWYLLQGYSLQCTETESREGIDPIIQFHLSLSIQLQVWPKCFEMRHLTARIRIMKKEGSMQGNQRVCTCTIVNGKKDACFCNQLNRNVQNANLQVYVYMTPV